MPFQSEKQRRYLWANEPEIARDWTDTYGSGIAKALGGRIGYNRGRVVNPGGYAGELSGSELFLKLYQEGKIDNLQQAMEDADRYDAGEKTHYEQLTGKDPLEMYQKYSDPSEVSLGSGLAEDAKQTIKSKKDELRQKMIESGVLGDLDLDQSYLSNEDYLADADARQLMASSGMFGTDATYVDKITPQTRGPREMFEMAARPREGLASIGPHGWEYGNQWQTPEQPNKGNWLKNIANFLPFVGKNTRTGAFMRTLRNRFMPEGGITSMFNRPTTPQQQATQRFMQNYNVGRNPQTGRMTSGPFAGRNLPGTSMFGSKTPQEMAQKWVDKYGDQQYTTKKQQQKQQEIINIATMNKAPPGFVGEGGQGSGPGRSDAGHAAAGGSGMHGGKHYDRGGLATLWPR